MTDKTKEASARSALKLALEALEYIENNYMSLPASAEAAITAIREALAEPSIPRYMGFAKGIEAKLKAKNSP